MKRRSILLLLSLFVSACATQPNGNGAATSGQSSVYDDPTYPGVGGYFGIGVGRWGGHSGGGASIGVGF